MYAQCPVSPWESSPFPAKALFYSHFKSSVLPVLHQVSGDIGSFFKSASLSLSRVRVSHLPSRRRLCSRSPGRFSLFGWRRLQASHMKLTARGFLHRRGNPGVANPRNKACRGHASQSSARLLSSWGSRVLFPAQTPATTRPPTHSPHRGQRCSGAPARQPFTGPDRGANRPLRSDLRRTDGSERGP